MKCTALSPSDTACARARAACLITSSSVCNVDFLSPWRTCGWQDRVDASHQQLKAALLGTGRGLAASAGVC